METPAAPAKAKAGADGHGGSAAVPPPAHAGMGALLGLGVRLAAGRVTEGRDFDSGAAVCRWARGAMERGGGGDLAVSLAGRRFELVGRRDRSAEVLAGEPGPAGYVAGKLKTDAMRFLAPAALTIADGARWRTLRPFNEGVLGTGAPHPSAQAFLDHVRAAFDSPVRDPADIRAAMGRAMMGIVLGNAAAGEDPAADVTALFAAVQSPLRRRLLGWRYRGRRERLYAAIDRAWRSAEPDASTLIALARRAAPETSHEELLEQVPHWMFTFTGSGTDLLARTLALVASRPVVLQRARDELAAAGPPDRAETLERLPFLSACLLETGRLFPPVTRTFHRAASGDRTEIVHWFPLLQRDRALGASVDAFMPERWLAGEPDAAAAASNLFLRGPRACPGSDLILFVCRGAFTRLLATTGVAEGASRLARDPLPVSFPARALRFTPAEGSS